MDSLLIRGGTRLRGEVQVSGSKNACLPIFAACLLTDQKCLIKNVPNLSDVNFMAQILRELGAEVSMVKGRMGNMREKNFPYGALRAR